MRAIFLKKSDDIIKLVDKIIDNVDENYIPEQPILTNAPMIELGYKFGKKTFLAYDTLKDEFVEIIEERELTVDEKIEMSRQKALRLIRIDELSDVELEDIKELYEPWESDTEYTIDYIVLFGDKLYQCIQTHISQSDWTPDITPALWKSKMPEGIIGEWVQPTGEHDGYMLGDKMLFTDGLVYESTIDGNVWSPTDNPSGWIVV